MQTNSSIATHGIQLAHATSLIGKNMINCQHRYHFRFHDFALGFIDSRHFRRHFSDVVSEMNVATSEFIRELVSLRQRSSVFIPAPSLLTHTELLDIIACVAAN